ALHRVGRSPGDGRRPARGLRAAPRRPTGGGGRRRPAGHAAPGGVVKVDLFGLRVDVITTEQTVERVMQACAGEGDPLVVFSCNVDMVVKAHRDPDFGATLSSADILTADGMPIVWMGRLRGHPFPERVAGSELVPRIAAACARAGRSVFLFGAAPGVADAAARRLQADNPGL